MITKRESEVLDLVAKGYTNAQISNTLDITIHTTKAHVAKLLTKFNVKSRARLASLNAFEPLIKDSLGTLDIDTIVSKITGQISLIISQELKSSIVDIITQIREGNTNDVDEILSTKPKVIRQAFPEAIRSIIFKRDNFKCLCCGSDSDLTIDHIKPISKGGNNHINNLQTLCKTCNLKKMTKTINYRAKNSSCD